MKTLIAIPCMDTLSVGFVQSLIYMHKGDNPTVYLKPNSLIYDSRNLLSLYAIENGYDNVLWLDSDMMFPPDTLLRLQAHELDMVTGLYVKRTPPINPVIFRTLSEPLRRADGKLEKNADPYTNYPHDTLFPVAACGFGCVLTSTKLLRAVWDKFGPAFTPYTWAGEDLSFCHRVNQLGYQIYCDSTLSLGHIGTHVFTENDLKGDTNG